MNTGPYRNELEAANAEIERLRAELNTSAKNIQQEEYQQTIRKHLKEKRNILQAIFISSQYCGIWPDEILRARIRIAFLALPHCPDEIRKAIEAQLLFNGPLIDRDACWQKCEDIRNVLFNTLSAANLTLTTDEMLTEIKATDSELEKIKTNWLQQTENTATKSDT